MFFVQLIGIDWISANKYKASNTQQPDNQHTYIPGSDIAQPYEYYALSLVSIKVFEQLWIKR